MTHSLSLTPPVVRSTARLEASVWGLIQRHGRWRVIRASLFARRLPRADNLPPHLRRDIGLPPEGPLQHPPRQHLL